MTDSILDDLLDRLRAGDATALLHALGLAPARVRRDARVRRTIQRLWVAHGTILSAWAATSADAATPARELIAALRPLGAASCFLCLLSEDRQLTIACDVGTAGFRQAIIPLGNVRDQDRALLTELLDSAGEPELQRAIRIGRALDREDLGNRFFRDLRAVRDLVSRSWTGAPDDTTLRDNLSLLLITRLLFLCFLQERKLLDGRTTFFMDMIREWSRRPPRGTLYRRRIRPLFFGALNRRPANRTAQARALGRLPYLNGGLFEIHPLERGRTALDLEDSVLLQVFDNLLLRYRFTTRADRDDLGIDPEMLGRMFEGLMPGKTRARTGSFYTPAPLVNHVVRETFNAYISGNDDAHASCDDDVVFNTPRVHPAPRLRDVRVLDPACGSGAFLLGALDHLVASRIDEEPDADPLATRQHVVGQNLHGVDLLADAALICSLRLWLTLIPGARPIDEVPPLPNLDRRIRQGDALIDPLTLAGTLPSRTHSARQILAGLEDLGRQYLSADPGERPRLRRRLHALEQRLARTWIDGIIDRLKRETREHTARAADRDLFDEPARYAAAASRRAAETAAALERMNTHADDLQHHGTLPFFSFPVHFPDAADGFDVVLCNPPWVRSHHWPEATRRALRTQYRVCTDAGWQNPGAGGAQVDLSLLFLELSIRLLRSGGVIGILLPARLLRSLYAGGARAMLLHDVELLRLEDFSAQHRAHFDADAFTCLVIARRTAARAARPPVDVHVHRRDGTTARFSISPDELPLTTGDTHAPWLVLPPDAARLLRRLRSDSPCIAELLPVKRGVMTAANDVLLAREVRPRLGDLAWITCEGKSDISRRGMYAGHIEATCLRPALRGQDVRAWRADIRRHIIWAPLNDVADAPAPRRLARFLSRHRERLPASLPPGTIQRVSQHTRSPRVCWADLAVQLGAVAVPAQLRSAAGLELPCIPLNTVYFIPTASDDDALLLAAFLNSSVLRLFASAIAERAKDSHRRFLGWTIGSLPLPRDWQSCRVAHELRELSARAHDERAAPDQNMLDELVAHAYALTSTDISALHDAADLVRQT